MPLVNFLNDLGIIGNENTTIEKDPNLIQGQEYLYYERVYANRAKRDLELLELTSSPNLESIIETLDNADSTKSNQSVTNVSISSLEDEFNRTLVKYNSVYKNFMETNVRKNIDNIKNNQYFKNLQRLNDKLISLAKVINDQLSNIIVIDNEMKKDLDTQQQKLNQYISTLDSDRKQMTGVSNNYDTISGENEQSKISLVSNKYNYFVWFILAATIIAITIHISASSSISNLKGGVLVIISLILLYFITQNIYNKYI